MSSQGLYLAFEKDNARYESRQSITETFVPTRQYWSLFENKHQFLLGCRGSGKTALLKMLSFPYLMHTTNQEITSYYTPRRHIGLHVTTDLRFIGSLQNKIWHNEEQEERYFIWKLNINIVKAFLDSLPDIIAAETTDTAKKIKIEISVCSQMHDYLFSHPRNLRASALIDLLDDYEDEQQERLIRRFRDDDVEKVHIDSMASEILSPFYRLRRYLDRSVAWCSELVWFICIDEAEYLTKLQIRILNSLIRTNTDRVYMKISTMPFSHSTTETNLGVPVSPGDDFGYVYLDYDPDQLTGPSYAGIFDFGEQLFQNRLRQRVETYEDVALSEVLDKDRSRVTGRAARAEMSRTDFTGEMAALRAHCDKRTVRRAEDIVGLHARPSSGAERRAFRDQIWRKVSGLIAVREAFARSRGNQALDAYFGSEIFVRCTDGVPRRMINLFLSLTKEMDERGETMRKRGRLARSSATSRKLRKAFVPRHRQTAILRTFSNLRFEQIDAVPSHGPQLRELVKIVAEYFHKELHERRISTDIVSCFSINENTDDDVWTLVKSGVEYGFMFPARSGDKIVRNPMQKGGTFRLAYSLAPRFALMPRRGRQVFLNHILQKNRESFRMVRHRINADKRQMTLVLGADHED